MPAPNNTKQQYINNWLSGETLRVMLLDDSQSYTFDPDSHAYVDDITSVATEATGSGYSRKTLSNVSITQDDTDDEGVLDADNVDYSGITAGTIQTIVVYRQVGGSDATPADDEVLAVFDDANVSDLPLSTGGANVTLEWSSEGIINIG